MPYLIIEVAGKWFSTTDASTAGYASITEIIANNGALALSLSVPDTTLGGTNPSGYWGNSVWDRTNLIDGDIAYANNSEGSHSSCLFLATNTSLDLSYYNRFALQIPGKPTRLDFWVGSPELRIPKQIKAYYCNSFVTTNLTNRDDTGLEYLGTIDIPSTLTTVTDIVMDIIARDPITVDGTVMSLNNADFSPTPIQAVSFVERQVGETPAYKVSGQVFPELSNGISPVRSVIGSVTSPIYAGSNGNIVVPGIITSPINDSFKLTSNRQGLLLETIIPDNNSISYYNLVVTPTHQYKSQLVDVQCQRKTHLGLGKFQLKVEDNIVVPFAVDSTNIDTIELSLTSDKFNIGVNKCILEYLYDSGSIERVPFEVTKEDPKRTIVERTFKNYDGGYIGDRFSNNYSYLPQTYPCFMVPDGADNALIKMSAVTDIPLARYTGVQGVQLDAVGVRVLVSFDKGITWKSLISGSWQTVDISNISTLGMREDVINSIVFARWIEIFKPVSLDFAIYLDDSLSYIASKSQQVVIASPGVQYTGSSYSNSITYNVPAGNIVTKVDVNVQGNYNSESTYASYGTVNIYKDTTLINTLTSYQGASNSTFIFDEMTNIKPNKITCSIKLGTSYYTAVANATIYAAPPVSYIKSLIATITPKLKTGYAFII